MEQQQLQQQTVDEDKHDNSNLSEWRESHSALLREWKRQAAVCLWLQIASHYHYARINNWITYPTVIITAATSIGIWGVENSEIGKFIMSGVSLFAGILATVAKHCRAAEKSNEFQLRSKEYLGIIREIDYILALDLDQRPLVSETMLRIRGAFDRIMDLQLDPPLAVIRLYEERFRSLESSMFGSDLIKQLESSPPSSADQALDNNNNNNQNTKPTTPGGSRHPQARTPTSPEAYFYQPGDRPSNSSYVSKRRSVDFTSNLHLMTSRALAQGNFRSRLRPPMVSSTTRLGTTTSQLDIELGIPIAPPSSLAEASKSADDMKNERSS